MTLSLLTPILLTIALMFVQGMLLQTACTIAGERKPEYSNALVTALIASIVAGVGSFAFSWTIGVVLWLFSSMLSWLATAGVWLALTAAIYRPRLGISAGSALAVALVHAAMSSVITGIIWSIVRYWPIG